MKFFFVELSCRIQLDGTKLREIFHLILLVFVSFATLTRGNCRRNKYSYNEIEHFRQFRTLSLFSNKTLNTKVREFLFLHVKCLCTKIHSTPGIV
jgi:hypothetical protein